MPIRKQPSFRRDSGAAQATSSTGQRARRGVLAALLALPFILLPQLKAQAQTNPQRMELSAAESFVQELADDALQALQIQTISSDERTDQFRTLLESGFQLEFIGLLVLGKTRRTASKEEIAEYQTYFSDFILKKYSILLGSYAGEVFVVTGSRAAGKRDVVVNAEIQTPNSSPIITDWRVRLFRGEPKIIDIKVEGISMVQSQREEFASILQVKGISGLTEMLRQETADEITEVPA